MVRHWPNAGAGIRYAETALRHCWIGVVDSQVEHNGGLTVHAHANPLRARLPYL